MEKKCFADSCKERVVFHCTDCKTDSYSCQIHLGNHAINYPQHNFKPIASFLREDQRSLIKKTIKDLRENFKNYRSMLLIQTKELMNFITASLQKSLNLLDKQEKEILHLLNDSLLSNIHDVDNFSKATNLKFPTKILEDQMFVKLKDSISKIYQQDYNLTKTYEEEEKKASIEKIKDEAGNFHAVRLSSMPLAQKHAHFDTLGLVDKISTFGAHNVKEILYSNDGQYVFVCNLYTDTCMK